MNKKQRIRAITAMLSGMLITGCAFSVSAATARQLYPNYMAATSVLAASDYGTYYAENLIDGNLNTAWVEGVSGNGEGQYVDYFFPAGTVITGGKIFDGYYKNEDLFFKNSAPSKLSFQSGSTIKTQDFSWEANNYDYSYSGSEFYFDEPIVCDGTLRVTIQSVRGGWKYTDTCISELNFYGYSAEEAMDDELSNIVAEPEPESSSSQGSSYGLISVDGSSQIACTGGTYRPLGSELVQLEQQIAANNIQKYMFSGFAARVLDRYYPGEIAETRMTASEVNDEAKALAFYWYQYHFDDSRMDASQMIVNVMTTNTMQTMLTELFGGNVSGAANILQNDYAQEYSAATQEITLNTTGDFGAVGYWYFGEPLYFAFENGRLKVGGQVIDSSSNSPIYTYAAYYVYGGHESLAGWQFSEVAVGKSQIEAAEQHGMALYFGTESEADTDSLDEIEIDMEAQPTGYTNSELEQMALDYYERHYGTAPESAEAIEEEDGTVILHLYSFVIDHTSTAAWYQVDRTGVGINYLTEDPVDLNN